MLSTPLQYLKGVGPRRAADFARVGLVTVEDLLYRFPIRYEDRSRLQPIASLRPGQTAAIAGRVSSCGGGIFLRGRGRARREHRKAGRGVREVSAPDRPPQ